MIGLRSVVRRTLAVAVLSAIALLGWLGGPGSATAQTQTAVEYYYSAWNFYFVTSFPAEIAALDGGAFGGAWQRTGQTFEVWSQATGGALPDCRFFSTGFSPKSSHFYTPYAVECTGLKAPGSGWQYEAIAFYVQLPDANGNCPAGTTILYRLYNNGMGGAPNHRFTTSATTFNQMLAAGWIFEGDGRTGASACVPESPEPPTVDLEFNGDLWCASQFVAVAGEEGIGGLVYTSPDGITWTARTTGTFGLRGIACDATGRKVALVGVGGTILISKDGGATWTPSSSGTQQDFNWVAFSGSLIVAVGTNGAIFTSSDAVAWTQCASGTANELYGIVWSGSQFVAAGVNDTILTSPDGVSWTPRASPTSGVTLLDVKWTGSLFIVPGTNGTILTSPDGVAWTRQNTGSFAGLHGVTWSGTQFVAVGAAGVILTSPDAIHWTPRNSGTIESLSDVAWSGSEFAAVGSYGTIVSSPDGATWTLR